MGRMRSRNRGPLAVPLGAAFAAMVLLSGTSCSDDNDDSVGSACKVIVDECHVGTSMGDCIDAIGPLPLECIDCIAAHHQCNDYTTCQRLPSGCRIPVELMGQ
jgi:hypothetical protein